MHNCSIVAANIYDMYTSKEILVSVFAIKNSVYLKKEIGADAAFIKFKAYKNRLYLTIQR